MYRNDMFYIHYPYDGKVARQNREVSHATQSIELYMKPLFLCVYAKY